MLEYRNVSYQIGEKDILKNVSFKLKKGAITALIGPNGSGKSTVIKMLLKNQSDYQGDILYDAQMYERYQFVEEIAILMQTSQIPDNLTLRQFIELSLKANRGLFAKLDAQDHAQIANALSQCECEDICDKRLNQLSGGERQRALIAASLARCPKILILDEPTTFLDIKYQAHILSLLRKLNTKHGVTILIVIHNLSHAVRLAEDILIIADGRIKYNGSADELDKDEIANIFDVQFSNDRKFHYTIKF